MMNIKRLSAGIIVVAVILLTGFLNDARGEEWRYFFSTDKGLSYYDAQTIKKTNSTLSVWTKLIFNEEGKKEAELFLDNIGANKSVNLSHQLTLFEIDCKLEMQKIRSMTFYDADGGVVHKSPELEYPWAPIAPDSAGEALHKRVCN
jgi:hypothetical protein